MLYNAARFNAFFRHLNKIMPSSFVDNMRITFMKGDSLSLDDIEGVNALYQSNFEALPRLRNYSDESIKDMISLIYDGLESYGLDYSYMGNEETFLLVEYPEGITDILVYKEYKNHPHDPTYLLFSAFLYVMDAFIRGEKYNEYSFQRALEFFDFLRHFPELDYLMESESFERGMSTAYSSIRKAVELPEYLLEDNSYIFIDGIYYEKESALKAIDAYSATAQSLERQDLEGHMTNSASDMPEDERISKFIRMLKDNRKRKI